MSEGVKNLVISVGLLSVCLILNKKYNSKNTKFSKLEKKESYENRKPIIKELKVPPSSRNKSPITIDIPLIKKNKMEMKIAFLNYDPLDVLEKKHKTNKISTSKDYPITKKEKLSISVSLPVSPSLRGRRGKIKSAPVSPILCGICITPPNSPPNSPNKNDIVIEGKWVIINGL